MSPIFENLGLEWGRSRSRSRSLVSSADDGEQHYTSELGSKALDNWAWGFIGGKETNEYGRASYNDQLKLLRRLGISEEFACPALKKLAELGSTGRNPQNINREISSTFIKGKLKECIFALEDSTACNITIPFHKLFAALYREFPELAKIHFGL